MRTNAWHSRSLLGRFLVWTVVLHTVVLQCFPGYVVTAFAAEAKAKAEKKAEAKVPAADLPAGMLTIGGRIGDQAEGIGDILIPLWAPNAKSLLFLDPRGSVSDNDEEEANIGLGFRSMLSLKKYDFILGGNIFYDSRWTQYDSQFNQLGLGVEFLSKWVDARANYYLPDTDKELVDTFTTEETRTSKSKSSSSSTHYGDTVYPEGNAFLQDARITYKETTTTRKTTTTFVFDQYEAALEGFDAEIGMKIPGLSDILETRAFVGYQKFDNPFGEDLEGFMGRLELRAFPGLTLDAQVFENEELNGTDYFVGGRIHVPFEVANIANGKSPFAGAGDSFKKAKAKPLISRITEQVIRDPKVRTASEAIEDVSKRTTSTQTSSETKTSKKNTTLTVLGDVEFVDSGNTSDPLMDGTYEHPKTTITGAVAQVKVNGNLYVEDDGDPYEGNLVLPFGVGAFGSGASIEGYNGRRYDATTHPTVLGDGTAPVFTMSENSTVAGFIIQNPAGAGGFGLNAAFNPPPTPPITGPIDSPCFPGDTYDVSRAGIVGYNVSGLTIRDNIFGDVSYGAVLVDTLTGPNDKFEADVIGNYFGGYEGGPGAAYSGLTIDTIGASGTFDVYLKDNVFNYNGNNGFVVDAYYYDNAYLTLDGVTAQHNGDDGLDIEIRGIANLAQLVVSYADTSYNQGDGIEVDEFSSDGGEITALFSQVHAYGNYANGLAFWNGGAVAYDGGDAFLGLSGVTARYNGAVYGGDGIYLGHYGAYSDGDNATLALYEVDASFNYGSGVYGDYGAYTEDGNAEALLENVTANENLYGGIWFSRRGSEADDSGDAFFGMQGVNASHNGRHGIYFGIGGAYAEDGDATFVAQYVTADDNAGDGIHFGMDEDFDCAAKTGDDGGDATAIFEHVQANYNHGLYGYWWDDYDYEYYWGYSGGHGIYFEDSGSATYLGHAYFSMYNVTAYGNDFSGIYFGEYGAVSRYQGDATFVMNGVEASCNGDGANGYYADGSGIHIDDAAARSGIYYGVGYGYYWLPPDFVTGYYTGYYQGGNATAIFTGIGASSNRDHGVSAGWAGGAYAIGGDALFQMVDAEANYNGLNGLYFGGPGAYAFGGDADFLMRDVTANYNGLVNEFSGIFFDTEFTVAHAYGGDATATFEQLTANYNGWYGLNIAGYGSVAVDGDATFTMRDIEASYNAAHGVFVGADAAFAYFGDARVTIENAVANSNGYGGEPGPWSGFYFGSGDEKTVAHAYYGDASAGFYNVTANNNTGYGIYSEGFGAYALYGGDATLTMSYVDASYNGYGGIHFLGGAMTSGGLINPVSALPAIETGAGDATLVLTDVTANWNGGVESGIHFDQVGASSGGAVAALNVGVIVSVAGGDATAILDDIEAMYNSGDGIHFGFTGGASALGGDALFQMTDVNASMNGGDGISFGMVGATALGGDALFYMGRVTANDNGQADLGNGIIFGLPNLTVAHALGGDASAVFEQVDASYNASYGFFVLSSGAVSEGGDALFEMRDVRASYNGMGGIHLTGSGAVALGAILDGNGTTGLKTGLLEPIEVGDATLRFINVDASHNGGADSGIHFGGVGAQSGGGFALGPALPGSSGDATVFFQNVTAYGNSGDGIHFGQGVALSGSGGPIFPAALFVDGDDAGYGNAYATFDDVEASYNGGFGIFAGPGGGAATLRGSAYLMMSDIDASWNGVNGIFFGGSAASATLENDAKASFEYVTAVHNGAGGLYFMSYGAFSGDDDAGVFMHYVDASYNGDDGICFVLDGAHSVNGSQARIGFDHFTANGNGGGGVVFEQSGAHAISRQAYLTMTDGEASGNAEGGIYFGGSMANGQELAIVDLRNITADGNGWSGISANYGAFSGAGDAELTMVNVGPNGNQYHGIHFGFYAAGSDQGDASATFREVTANANGSSGLFGAGGWVGSSGGVANVTISDSEFSGNDDDGVYIPVWGNGGQVNVTIRNTAVRTNDNYGIRIEAGGTNAPTFNLDVGSAGSSGLNSIQGNGYAGVYNSGSGTVTVVNNYWGGSAPLGGTPPAIDYVTPGVADPGAAWLALDPNP